MTFHHGWLILWWVVMSVQPLLKPVLLSAVVKETESLRIQRTVFLVLTEETYPTPVFNFLCGFRLLYLEFTEF